jgi:BirA family biotin operon repressor/biotin-[acetyl-CoA-carboxylase] ligase
MDFTSSSKVAARLLVLDRVGSTNDELADRARREATSDWPEFSVVVTGDQTSGRGRLGREWSAPAGTMLAISVLLRPERAGIRNEALGWIPLLAGLAMTRALRGLGADAELKWPNDVLIAGRKVCGILAEAQADGAVVVGSGVNLTMTPEQLPVPTATSLHIEGTPAEADAVLAGYLNELKSSYTSFSAAGGDAEASGLRSAVEATCSTLGRMVRVQLPDGTERVGLARSLDATGRLVVEVDGRLTAVAAGDVIHLRY